MVSIQFGVESGVEAHTDVADAMVVGGNLRYVTMEKESDMIEGGSLVRMKSDEDMKVSVKAHATGETKMFKNARFAKHESEESMVYVSGPGFLERVVGEIVRIKRIHLPK